MYRTISGSGFAAVTAMILLLVTGPAAASSFEVGYAVTSGAGAVVRAVPDLSAPPLATHNAGVVGSIVAGPLTVADTDWYEVDFAGAVDGWLPGTALFKPYFPPSEGSGGWRSLVPLNTTPTTAQQSSVRGKAGLDWAKLKLASDYSRGFTTTSNVLVIRNGYVAGEWGSRAALGVASISKSLTGVAVARLFDLAATGRIQANLQPTEPAYLHLPSTWDDAQPGKRSILLQDLMSMSSGLQPHDKPGVADYLSIVLGRQQVAMPNREWAYSSLPVDLLSIVVQNATGLTLRSQFNQQVAAPLGIAPLAWGTFGNATTAYTGASSKAQIALRDLARVGYLMMLNGRWSSGDAQQGVLRPQSVSLLLRGLPCGTPTTFVSTPGSPFIVDAGSARRYGHLWWNQRNGTALGSAVPRDAFYAHGFKEALLVVVPSLNMLVLRQGAAPDSLPAFRVEFMKRVMAAVVGPVSTQQAPAVQAVQLIDADTDRNVDLCGNLPADAVIDLATAGTRNLNIAATLSGPPAGSVRFDLDGGQLVTVDSAPPYALAGETAGDYAPWTPAAGEHVLAITPFSGPDATGNAGATSRLSFSVIDQGVVAR